MVGRSGVGLNSLPVSVSIEITSSTATPAKRSLSSEEDSSVEGFFFPSSRICTKMKLKVITCMYTIQQGNVKQSDKATPPPPPKQPSITHSRDKGPDVSGALIEGPHVLVLPQGVGVEDLLSSTAVGVTENS